MQIEQLEKITEWFWTDETVDKNVMSFGEKCDQLHEWIETNNKIPSPASKDLIERSLGKWCSRQRTNKKNNKLSVDKILQLEKLDRWYWIK